MKAVVFDLGRVLVDYDHARTLAAVAQAYQCTAEQVTQLFAAVGDDLQTGSLGAQDLHLRLAEAFGQRTSYIDFARHFCTGLTRNERALAYAVALQTRPGITVAVISNTNDGHVVWLDEHVPELKALDLVMMSNEVGMAKPDPAIFQLALELLDLPPASTIFIDDLAENVRAAQAMGMAGIVHSDWLYTQPALESWLADDSGADVGAVAVA